MNNRVLIYIEVNNGVVARVSKEIISHAKQNFLQSSIDGIVLGDEQSIDSALFDLKQLGLNKLYIIKDNLLDMTNAKVYANALSVFLENNQYDVLLMGATSDGRDIAPRLASKQDIGLTADCTGLEFDENGNLLATRPTYGGQLMATIVSKTKPNFATVRPGAFKYLQQSCNNETEIEYFSLSFDGLCSLLEVLYSENKPAAEDWTCSEIIVAGGLGLQNKENFNLIYKLADLLGAKPAASRAAVEQGWAEQSIQVGQTGNSVSPKLYIAFGISGAMQHMTGITNADKIVAININKDAPIMSGADIAIECDAVSLLHTLIGKLSD